MLNAASALPQLEQADKLMARMPPAKWAADMRIAASELGLPEPSALLRPEGISSHNRDARQSSVHRTISHGSFQLKEDLGNLLLFAVIVGCYSF